MPDRLVISNTSPLLYLHQVGHLELLPRLYGQVRIPRPCGRSFEVPHDTSLLLVVVDFGSREAEAIALSVAHPGSLLIQDDSQDVLCKVTLSLA